MQVCAPGEVDSAPAGHGVQLEEPVSSAKLPGGHGTQSVLRVAPVAPLNVPSGHGVQSLSPVNSWYDPASQGVHSELPETALNVPFGQFAQKLTEDAPSNGMNVPATQL